MLTMLAPVVMLLPAHNEEPRWATSSGGARARRRAPPSRWLVVDDGSTDATAAEAVAAGAAVHALGVNRGLGAAVRTGLGQAVARGAAAVAFLDADGEYAPRSWTAWSARSSPATPTTWSAPASRACLRTHAPHRWLGNLVLTRSACGLVARRWGVRRLTDGQSGYRALSPAAAAAEIVHDFNYAQVLTLDLLAKGFRYAEVPDHLRFRRHGRSFVRLVPYLRQVVPAVRGAGPAPCGRQSSTTKLAEAVAGGPPGRGVEASRRAAGRRPPPNPWPGRGGCCRG